MPKSSRSPAFTRKKSRIFFGIVTWPFVVTVVLGIAVSSVFLTLGKENMAEAQRSESLQTVAPRPGVTLPFILTEPPTAPVASVILFTGSEGVLGFKGPGPYPRGANFLVRNRQRFASHGLLVAVIDVPSDYASGYGRYRMTEGHARDVAVVIAALRQLAPVPVWLAGTSNGSISAVNVAARLEAGGADGLVITSSPMKSRGMATVYDVGLRDVRIPTLVVHHEQDACSGTPGTDARMLGKSVRAPRTELLLFRGGAGGGTGDAACGPFAAHGYFGIDDEVVKAIADWIKR